MKTIKGKNIYLTEIARDDLIVLMNWRNKDSIRKYFFSRRKLTLPDQKKWFKKYLLDDTDKMFIIRTREGIKIGTLALYHIDVFNKTGEFGRFLIGEEPYLGKGFGKEAMELILNYGFKELNLYKIYLEVYEFNSKAISLYKDLGFQTEGVLKEQVKDPLDENKRQNVLLMGLLQTEFHFS